LSPEHFVLWLVAGTAYTLVSGRNAWYCDLSPEQLALWLDSWYCG